MSARLQPGDLVIVSGSGWISGAIRRLTPRRGGEPVWATHVGVIGRGGPREEATIVHARVRVVEEPLLERYPPDGEDRVAIFRMLDLGWQHRHAIATEARAWLGSPYGGWRLLFHAGDYALGGRYVFRRLARMDDYPICSWLTGRAYEDAIGRRLGAPYRKATPHHQWRHVTEETYDEWATVVGPSGWPSERGIVSMIDPEADE